jgi:hypothetical protein
VTITTIAIIFTSSGLADRSGEIDPQPDYQKIDCLFDILAIVNINLLQKLKQKLRQEPILGDIWEFYSTHFLDHVEFINMGETRHSEELEAAIVNSCRQMFENKGELLTAEIMSIYLEKYRFFHGSVKIEGRYGGMFYFEDIKMGLLAIPGEPPMVKYSRFSISKPNLN